MGQSRQHAEPAEKLSVRSLAGRRTRVEREAVEFHDSVLAAVTTEAGNIRILLAPAYIHRSAGEPGQDPGTGWSANVEIVVGAGTVELYARALPAEIWEGTLHADRRELDNVVPIPFENAYGCELSLTLNRGDTVRIRGKGIAVRVIGPYEFVEDVTAG